MSFFIFRLSGYAFAGRPFFRKCGEKRRLMMESRVFSPWYLPKSLAGLPEKEIETILTEREFGRQEFFQNKNNIY